MHRKGSCGMQGVNFQLPRLLSNRSTAAAGRINFHRPRRGNDANRRSFRVVKKQRDRSNCLVDSSIQIPYEAAPGGARWSHARVSNRRTNTHAARPLHRSAVEKVRQSKEEQAIVGPQGVRDLVRLRYKSQVARGRAGGRSMDIAAPTTQPARSMVYADLE